MDSNPSRLMVDVALRSGLVDVDCVDLVVGDSFGEFHAAGGACVLSLGSSEDFVQVSLTEFVSSDAFLCSVCWGDFGSLVWSHSVSEAVIQVACVFDAADLLCVRAKLASEVLAGVGAVQVFVRAQAPGLLTDVSLPAGFRSYVEQVVAKMECLVVDTFDVVSAARAEMSAGFSAASAGRVSVDAARDELGDVFSSSTCVWVRLPSASVAVFPSTVGLLDFVPGFGCMDSGLLVGRGSLFGLLSLGVPASCFVAVDDGLFSSRELEFLLGSCGFFDLSLSARRDMLAAFRACVV